MWAHSHEFLSVDSFWGANRPNNRTGNSDDCGVMVLQSNAFWWEDRSCLVQFVQQHVVAPICQHDSTAATTTTEVTQTTLTTTAFGCPSGWSEFDGRCYIVKASIITWDAALRECLNLGGNLASIHSRAEHDFIVDLAPQNYQYWIGGTRSGSNEWVWSDGSQWDYEYWYQESSSASNQCILTYYDYGWFNTYCFDTISGYICKI